MKEFYSNIAEKGAHDAYARSVALYSGYTEEELNKIPPEARLGLGCGNSVAAACLKPGEHILDLGCGAGMDVFLCGELVGPKGKSVGVDFSEEMLKKAKEIAVKYKRENVEFHLSPIDTLPFPNDSFDVIISNCVLNLVPDKLKAFKDIYRVLKSKTGRLVVSDIVLKKPLPEELEKSVASICGCIGRAVDLPTYKAALEQAGFANVSIEDKKKDLIEMYSFAEEGGIFAPCSGGGCCKFDLSVFAKYDMNEYAMSCCIKGFKN